MPELFLTLYKVIGEQLYSSYLFLNWSIMTGYRPHHPNAYHSISSIVLDQIVESPQNHDLGVVFAYSTHNYAYWSQYLRYSEAYRILD